ncbi:MAG: hypothetical protein A3F72_19650 [Bacteroidetes bacterium RIFCSPLOWO2_12_FULL_35_15]|nr:MAG: hypothetical protein A3F72_19650 [Bacteroidetes bacterium RIFCSPLOWO2_12_FULL_35_15]
MLQPLAGFFNMQITQIDIINKILNAIDSDDLLELASFIECRLPIEEIYKIKRILILFLKENKLNADQINKAKQFINFLGLIQDEN